MFELRNVDEMQTGNGRASSGDHLISVTGVGCCEAEVIGTDAGALREKRIDQRLAPGVLRGDRGEPHGAAVADIGVGGNAGLRADNFLKISTSPAWRFG